MSSADCATPTARAAVWMRADSKVCISCRKAFALHLAQEVLRRTANPSKASSYSFMPR
jgi:hypothetical protein